MRNGVAIGPSLVERHHVPEQFVSLFAFKTEGNKCYQNASLVAFLSAYVRLGSPSLNWGLVADLHREHQVNFVIWSVLLPLL